MANVPNEPKIYHITHLRNLPQIIATGCLYSDAKRIEKSLNCDVVGMSHIKKRRLTDIEVGCHAGTHVGDYVPFYFCPRSIMLFILHKGNHPDLDYAEGQAPIIHLRADLHRVIQWADSNARKWAFSDRNAGGFLARFYRSLGDLGALNWTAIEASDFRESLIKEGKAAEFLFHHSFPWHLVEQIGVHDESRRSEIVHAIKGAKHKPVVRVERSWYY